MGKVSKLWNHEKDAVIDALAILETVPEARKQVQPGTIDKLRAMAGLPEVIEDYMNKAIGEMIDNYPAHGRE